MKKIFSLIGIVFILFLGGITYKYYNDTYVGKTAYALVPTTVPNKELTKDSSGKIISNYYSYNYTLEFVDEKGEVAVQSYELSSQDPTPLTPNTYVTAEISKKRIVEGPNPIDASQIPENVLAKLK
ncbi:MAG: YxeA family protein [Enterococcus sp.]|jgi:uncharacterized protein YxeA|nr:YxeA family protein [Enterococcus sp.]